MYRSSTVDLYRIFIYICRRLIHNFYNVGAALMPNRTSIHTLNILRADLRDSLIMVTMHVYT